MPDIPVASDPLSSGTVIEYAAGHQIVRPPGYANVVLPPPEDVESGVSYGEDGTQYTGTLLAGGGGGNFCF